MNHTPPYVNMPIKDTGRSKYQILNRGAEHSEMVNRLSEGGSSDFVAKQIIAANKLCSTRPVLRTIN
jgi:hypothetical protein